MIGLKHLLGCTVIIRLLYPRQNGHPHADCICIQDILDENVYLSSVGLFTLVVSKKIWTNYMIQVYWVVIVSNKDWTKTFVGLYPRRNGHPHADLNLLDC